MTKKTITQISKEELAPVINARARAVELATKAEGLLKEARMAELEYKVAVQDLYLSNGIDNTYQVDIGTGEVRPPQPTVAPEVAATAPAEKAAKKVAKKTTKKTTKKA